MKANGNCYIRDGAYDDIHRPWSVIFDQEECAFIVRDSLGTWNVVVPVSEMCGCVGVCVIDHSPEARALAELIVNTTNAMRS